MAEGNLTAKQSLLVQIVNHNIIKTQAGAGPLAPLDHPKWRYKAVVSLMKGCLLQNWASIHLYYGGQFICLYTHLEHALAGGGGDSKVQNGFPSTGMLINSPSPPATKADGTSNSPGAGCLPVSRG